MTKVRKILLVVDDISAIEDWHICADLFLERVNAVTIKPNYKTYVNFGYNQDKKVCWVVAIYTSTFLFNSAFTVAQYVKLNELLAVNMPFDIAYEIAKENCDAKT